MGSLYVLSDVHGHRDDLARGLDRAGFGGDDELWVLGDLVDRGPDGIGVVDLLRDLQRQAPDRVHVLMGNHEILALGRHRFPDSKFADSWRINGGLASDQEAMTDAHVAWLAGLPLMARVRDFLFMHSDTAEYLTWGRSVEEVNTSVREALADVDDLEAHWEVWAALTSRFQFAVHGGADVARAMLDAYGGEMIVHGHTMVGLLTGRRSAEVQEPVRYADGRVVAIDGGRYDGGPLLIVRLD